MRSGSGTPQVPLPTDDLVMDFQIRVTPMNNAYFSYHWHVNIKGACDVNSWSRSGIEASYSKAEAAAKQACELKALAVKHSRCVPIELGYRVQV